MNFKVLALGLSLFVFFGVNSAIAEETSQGQDLKKENKIEEQTEKKEAPNFCPVCGPGDELEGLSFAYKYEGVKYSFCSMGCVKAFKKDPEYFLSDEYEPKGHSN